MDLDFHDLIAAQILSRIQNAFFPQPEFLPALRTLRHFQNGPAVDGGHFDLGPQHGFPNGHRHLHFNIVALAHKQGVLFHSNRDVEVTRRAAHRSGIAFARDPQTAAVSGARGDAHLHLLRPHHAPFALATRTGIRQAAFSLATGTRHVEAHGTRHLRHFARAGAVRTGAAARSTATSGTGFAGLVTVDGQPDLGSFDRLPEIDVEGVFEVRTTFGHAFGLAAAEEGREKVLESAVGVLVSPGKAAAAKISATRASPAAFFEIEAAKVKARRRATASRPTRAACANIVGIEAVRVVDLALLGVVQHVIGFLDALETVFGVFVPGVQIRVILARQLAIGLTDLVIRGGAGDAQQFVIVLLFGRHVALSAFASRPGLPLETQAGGAFISCRRRRQTRRPPRYPFSRIFQRQGPHPHPRPRP